MIDESRKAVLLQIDKLVAGYDSADPAEKKLIDKKLIELRPKLVIDRRTKKIESLKQKGADLNFKEIKYLLDQNLTLHEVSGITSVPINALRTFVLNSSNKNENSTKEVKKETAIHLLRGTDLRVVEIARKLEMPTSTVYYLAKTARAGK